ncbi:sigma-54 interaction domain-containing protein [Cytobacillus firmus]|uniref:HTH-type transcriptional regulatory protein TyrR n=1 Tax=Cytobacillus firmus DS1 TaxID=1307436 RepID=W7KUS3_CYTFI|nr:sigma 54-interacting transcriptional regulator [Cytobacillus firmus]EWG09948.1 transcriptional regulator containing PAS AAA-type ATPase and DNA-binding domains-like protein [Cytobacillus firmus DS1]
MSILSAEAINKELLHVLEIPYQLFDREKHLIFEQLSHQIPKQHASLTQALHDVYLSHSSWTGTIPFDDEGEMEVKATILPIGQKAEFSGVIIMYQLVDFMKFKEYQEIATDFKVLFDSSYDVIFVSDSQGNTLRVSSACERLWGKSQEEFIGKNVYELEQENLFSPSVTSMVLKEKRRITAMQKTSTGKNLLVVGTPIKDKNGNIIRVINASRDLTEVTKLEDEIKEIREIAERYKRELEEMKSSFSSNKKLIYSSTIMENLAKQVRSIAQYNSSVLITGESGVGKEIIASMIHEHSNRSNKPFIKINCGAIPESLLESELFGYERGTFTGAVKEGKKGLFLAANHGTILLDEVTEMPLALQVKLLRVLQESELRRVGSVTPIDINVRIIASTNRDIQTLIKEGKFREDLYYRLNVIPIEILPLRERKEDIPILADHFTQQFNKEYDSTKTLSACAKQELLKHPWKGNIRELKNFVERLLIVSPNVQLTAADVAGLLNDKSNIHTIYNAEVPFQLNTDEKMDLYKTLENVERQLLEKAAAQYNTTIQIAEALNINQSTVSKKLKKYRIHINKYK